MRRFWLLIVTVLLLGSFAAAQDGKHGTWNWSWMPDASITQVCSTTVTTQCADKFQLYIQLGAAPAPATDTLVGSPAITTLTGPYSFAGVEPFGTYTFYVVACAKDKTGASQCSVASGTTVGTFKPNPPTALSVAVS